MNIKEFITGFTKTWLAGQYNKLYDFFDEKVVMLPPGSVQPVTGVEAMVKSYRQFLSMGTIHSFDITDIGSYEFEETIICHMQFAIDYQIESGRFKEKGIEVYTLRKVNNTFKIIWRAQLSLDSKKNSKSD